MSFELVSHARSVAWSGCEPTEVFAKLLAENDDSGRHGVVIPIESYGFFPHLAIDDPSQNATELFHVKNANSGRIETVAWKYYQRYPERRLTRLDRRVNARGLGRRLLVVFKYSDDSGQAKYAIDTFIEAIDHDFLPALVALFGEERHGATNGFVQRPVQAGAPYFDRALRDLLTRFDEIASMGFVDSLRSGSTGLGYTFETLMGIEENNDQTADYFGIEIKCKLRKEAGGGGKTNLFQLGPTWRDGRTGIERLRAIGNLGADGRYTCHSQVTTSPNNKGLRLAFRPDRDIDLRQHDELFGQWTSQRLAQRLAEKHSRAVFVKADSRAAGGGVKYHYNELVYCEQPDIDRFLAMVEARSIVFEFMMHEAASGSVRNHGYPWRLCDEKLLDGLFAVRAGLRARNDAS